MTRITACLSVMLVLSLPANAQWERIDTNIGATSSATLVASTPDYLFALLRLPGNGSAMYRSPDAGDSWEAVGGFPNPGFSPNVFMHTNGYLVVAGESGSAQTVSLVSADQGASWTVSSPAGFAIPRTAFAVGNTLYLGTDNLMARSTDGGASWSNLENSPIAVSGMAGQGALLAVGMSGVVHRSTDSGTSWSAVGAPIPASQVTGIWSSGSDIYVKGILAQPFKTSDDGATWNQVALFNPFLYNSVEVSPSGSAWAMLTGLAAPYLSLDAGASATDLAAGFPTNIGSQACTNATLVTDTHVVANAWGCLNDNTGVYRWAHSGSTANEEETLSLRFAISAYPNPVLNEATVRLQVSRPGTAHLAVYDIQGRVMLTRSTALPGGDSEVRLALGALSSGLYLVRVTTEDGARTTTLMRSK